MNAEEFKELLALNVAIGKQITWSKLLEVNKKYDEANEALMHAARMSIEMSEKLRAARVTDAHPKGGRGDELRT